MSQFTGVPIELIPTLTDHVLANFHRRGMFETIFKYQQYLWLDRIFPQHKLVKQSGNSIDVRYLFDGNGSFRFSSIDAPRRQINDASRVRKGNIPWKMCDFYITMEEHTISMARDEAELYDYMEGQIFEGMKSMADGVEEGAAGVPEDSDDALSWFGFPWWVRGPSAGVEDYEGGFIGTTSYYQDGTGTTSQAGLDVSAIEQLRNFAGNHSGFGVPLLKMVRKGRNRTNYRPPQTPEAQQKMRAATRLVVWPQAYEEAYQEMVTNRFSDGRNRDVAPNGPEETFRLMNTETVGYALLDDDVLEPVYDINFAYLKPVTLRGWWWNVKPTKEHPQIATRQIKEYFGQANILSDNPRLAGACYTKPRS